MAIQVFAGVGAAMRHSVCVCHPSFLGVSFQACKGTGHHWHCCPTKRVSVGAEAVEDAPLCRIAEGNGSRRTVYVGSFPSIFL